MQLTPIEIAAGEIGTVENPENSNKTKYGEWYNWNGVPWCMIFVQYCFSKAGKNLPLKTASCSGLLGWYKARFPEKIVDEPKPNDVIIYNFGHTGIFERDDGGYIIAIEGNTSPDDKGSQSNGDGVYKRRRKKSLVTAYIRPFEFESEDDYMTKEQILKELGDQYITTFDELPNWARKPMRELLDEGIVNGGTDAAKDPDDINMFLSDIKSIVVMKRLIDNA